MNKIKKAASIMTDFGSLSLKPEKIPIFHSSDVIVAKRKANSLADAIGFDNNSSHEISLVVSELATNMIKHANQGMVTLFPITEGQCSGIQIEGINGGTGIADLEEALTDGFSTAGSLGYGLGTVNRSMDEFEIKSNDGFIEGVKIVCKRWKPIGADSIVPCPLDVGVASRPHPKMHVNGDAFVIKKWDESLLVGVIDGLGHGQFAHKASQQARNYIERHPRQNLNDIFLNVQRSCRSTRGVVMALARFDFGLNSWSQGSKALQNRRSGNLEEMDQNPDSTIHMKFASVGNIEARALTYQEPCNFIVRRGIIGRDALKPVITDHQWNLNNVMVLHSDGLSTRWQWDDFPHLFDKSASLIAQGLIRALAKDNDDAAVVVVKSKNA